MSAGGRSERILVVDDSEDTREVLSRTLGAQGYHVRTAANAAEALAALAGSWGWVLAMRGHAAHHEHLDPRVFLLQYTCLLIILGAATVMRLGRASTRDADAGVPVPVTPGDRA